MTRPTLKKAGYLPELPVEIVLLVSKDLLGVDAVCSALTCKVMFTILNTFEGVVNAMRLNSPQRKKIFLMKLEKGISGLLYFPCSTKLSPFDCTGREASKVTRSIFPYFIPTTGLQFRENITYE
ncbi:hypothetical protein F5B21DRAFT_463464 [Xylaria acuta]|nr:hypothetical protein F5B21DRAFT_463464 [Xylaria acuta]